VSKPTNDTTFFDGSIFLGIDGGGTKCKAVLMDHNQTILGVGISGPGNPVYGVELAKNSIVESAKIALEQAKSRYLTLCDLHLGSMVAGIGLAGANVPQMYKEMSEWKSPFKAKYITTDLLIACLGAHNGRDGAVMISGTGSCGYSYVKGQSTIIGAHGFPQGDKGSGAWFGLQAVEASLLSLDKIGPKTSMLNFLLEKLKVNNAEDIVAKFASKPSSTFASVANVVFLAAQENDQVALAIIKEGAEYINTMARLLDDTTPPRITLIGGLTAFITPYLDAELQLRLAPSLSPPEVGAVLYAIKQSGLSARQIPNRC
jgi:glucosamine kinase